MRIFLVEDEERPATTLGRGLRAEGYVVDGAYDGAEGLRLARRYPYRAFILDIMLPGLNGFAVCDALRRDCSTVPILISSHGPPAPPWCLDQRSGSAASSVTCSTTPPSMLAPP